MRRERVNEDSVHAKTIDEHFKSYKMVPAEITCSLIENEILQTQKVNIVKLHKFNCLAHNT